jgi:hypothetical protein
MRGILVDEDGQLLITDIEEPLMAKVPRTGMCVECKQEVPNPAADLTEWKAFLQAYGLGEKSDEDTP